MSIDAEILPVSHVEELVRALVKGLRAFQMYLPNNPMYQRAEQQLRDTFPPVWSVFDELTLLVSETDLVWEDQVVYSQPTKSESFAFGLYKDGMRVLIIRKGAEDEEVPRFLQTISRARLLPADANDDLLTLLWEQDFKRITYQFAEVISDPWVYDPQALALEARGEEPEQVQSRVREELAVSRPEGLVDLEEFDSTLYFLDEIEIAALNSQVEEEYHRDLRSAALDIVYDLLEFQRDPEVRGEILAIIETLFPNILSRGEFRAVAGVLRELRQILQRAEALDPATRQRMEAVENLLSEPATIAQLLQSLDEAEVEPSEADLGEVLRELKPMALGSILTQLPLLGSERIRGLIGAAAERLAAANNAELVRLLETLGTEALPGAIRLAGRLGAQAGIGPLAQLVKHVAPEVRLAAVEVLGELGTPGAMAALEPAIDDENRAVRVAAVTAVSRRGYAGALRRLQAIVLGKGSLAIERGERRQIFEAYAAIGGPAALETLRNVALPQGLFRRRAATDARTCAVYALGRLRSPEARLVVEELAEDKELPVRHAAVSLLREWPG
jgi:HEAT repeat protein